MSDTLTAPARLHRRTFSLLFIALMSVGMGQSLAFIVVPPAARQLGLSEFEVGLVFSMSALLWMLTSPFWGRMSDSLGRRRIIVAGLAGYALSLIFFITVLYLGQIGAIAAGIFLPLLIFTRMINGGLGSATRPASLGFVVDFTTSSRRTQGLSRVESGFHLGVFVGPMLGSLLFALGSYLSAGNPFYSQVPPFYFFASFGIISAIIVWFVLPESRVQQRAQTRNKSKRSLSYLDKRILPFLVLAVLNGLGNATFTQTSAFYFLDYLGVSQGQIYTLTSFGFGLMSAGMLAMTLWLVPRWRISSHRLLSISSYCMVLSCACMVLGQSLLTALAGMMLFGVATGLQSPGRLSGLSHLVPPSEQGAAMGMLGGVMPLGHIASPILIMPLYVYEPRLPFVLLGALAIAAIALVHFNRQLRMAH